MPQRSAQLFLIVSKKGYGMFKTLLVPLFGQAGDKEILELAHGILETGGHMNCLYIHDDAAAVSGCIQTDAYGVPIATEELIAAVDKECSALKARARQTFDRFCKTYEVSDAAPSLEAASTRSASWREVSADIVEGISKAAHYNDAVVLRRGPKFAEPTFADIGKITIGSGRPLLVFPEDWQPHPIRHIAIAWKDTPEAARAVSSAMTVLKQARTIRLLSARETDGEVSARESADACAAYLRWHGLEAEISCIDADEDSAKERVFSDAGGTGAELIVMGAYGHSRAHEFVFGGFTRRALHESAIPLLLMH
jgi:nucleotide-binding universal stress UspA family protein